jgi:class I fructose-bisphosphate aldolase
MIDDIFAEVRAVRGGGANGSVIGRNTFRRPKVRALDLLNKIYLDKG